mmetsp:Transcript_28063/g.60929  ORF Transcript_28063/g.60929 Transcript_28063/m.60929 type:complete len:418 (+) Transcript_28063:1302-2555(+)
MHDLQALQIRVFLRNKFLVIVMPERDGIRVLLGGVLEVLGLGTVQFLTLRHVCGFPLVSLAGSSLVEFVQSLLVLVFGLLGLGLTLLSVLLGEFGVGLVECSQVHALASVFLLEDLSCRGGLLRHALGHLGSRGGLGFGLSLGLALGLDGLFVLLVVLGLLEGRQVFLVLRLKSLRLVQKRLFFLFRQGLPLLLHHLEDFESLHVGVLFLDLFSLLVVEDSEGVRRLLGHVFEVRELGDGDLFVFLRPRHRPVVLLALVTLPELLHRLQKARVVLCGLVFVLFLGLGVHLVPSLLRCLQVETLCGLLSLLADEQSEGVRWLGGHALGLLGDGDDPHAVLEPLDGLVLVAQERLHWDVQTPGLGEVLLPELLIAELFGLRLPFRLQFLHLAFELFLHVHVQLLVLVQVLLALLLAGLL